MPVKHNDTSQPATVLGALQGGTISALAIGQYGESRIFMGTGIGLFRSTGFKDGEILGWERLPEAPLGIMSLAVSPDFPNDHLIIAGANTGIYLSQNLGATWRAARMPSSTSMVVSLCFSPDYQVDGVIFAGTLEDGVFVSNNRGERWYAQSFGLLDATAYALAISPNFTQDGTIFAGTGTALYYSYNSGRAWKKLSFPEDAAPILSLALQDLGTGYVLYAGTETRGLFSSCDEGQTWLSLDFPAASVNALVTSSDHQRLLAATEKGIFQSQDQGRSWSALIELSDALAMAIHGDLTLAGLGDEGLWLSTDLSHWTQVQNLAIRPVVGQVLSPRFEADGIAYIFGPEEGIFRTQDGGYTWNDVNDGLPSLEINGLVLPADFSSSHTLLAASGEGILSSADAGESWHTLTKDPASLVSVSPNGRILAAGFFGEGVRVSDDQGKTWEALPGPWDTTGGKLLSLAVTNVHHYYLAYQAGMGETMTLWQGKVGHFEKVLSEPVGENPHIAFWFPSGPATDRPWYAGLGSQVWKISGRAGGIHSHAGLFSETGSPQTILSITGIQDQAGQIVLFACTGQTIYRSQDGGAWTPVYDFGAERAIAITLSSSFLADQTAYVLLLGGVFCKIRLLPKQPDSSRYGPLYPAPSRLPRPPHIAR